MLSLRVDTMPMAQGRSFAVLGLVLTVVTDESLAEWWDNGGWMNYTREFCQC